jgi:hypothetical protein
MSANVTITSTYTTSDGTTIPIDIMSWAHLTQDEATVTVIQEAIVAQAQLGNTTPGTFHDTWSQWWKTFSQDPKVKITVTEN